MGVVVWGYRGGVGTLRIPYKLSTLGGFRYITYYTHTHMRVCRQAGRQAGRREHTQDVNEKHNYFFACVCV